MRPVHLPRFYPILDIDRLGSRPWRDVARALISGGARLIQLRHKSATTRQLFDEAATLVRLAKKFRVRILINDRADVAWLSHANGVHLGQDDLSAKMARKLLGPKKMIGLSTHNLDQALRGDKQKVNYLAVGPIFETRSKEPPDPVVGLSLLQKIRDATRHPIVAIGGITLDRVPEVLQAGADSVAVIQDVLAAPNVEERVREYLNVLGK